MARLKNTKNVDIEKEQDVETPELQDSTTKDTEETHTEEPVVESEPTELTPSKNEEAVEPSEFVQKILASYPNYSALYIDTKGGTYPSDTQPNLVSDAILYQNPYYKQ